MPLALAVAVLLVSIFAGGSTALWRGHPAVLAALRSFAIVGAAMIAVLHLLPEAIEEVGFAALVATGGAYVAPGLLERLLLGRGRHHDHDAHEHEPPERIESLLAYGAVLAHQFGEGALVGSLATAGALSSAVVMGIAGHTIPLAMVVAARVSDLNSTRATARSGRILVVFSLMGIAAATVAGVSLSSLVSSSLLKTFAPWMLAVIAGLLLHALSHGPPAASAPGRTTRIAQLVASVFGFFVALLGAHQGDWVNRIPVPVQMLVAILTFTVVVYRLNGPRVAADHHHE